MSVSFNQLFQSIKTDLEADRLNSVRHAFRAGIFLSSRRAKCLVLRIDRRDLCSQVKHMEFSVVFENLHDGIYANNEAVIIQQLIENETRMYF